MEKSPLYRLGPDLKFNVYSNGGTKSRVKSHVGLYNPDKIESRTMRV